ncbi:MAG: hypothetical protein RLZZ519_2284 [Bacteroidota bacterium]|jgi:hypothetical protein
MNWIQSLRHRYAMRVFEARAKKVSFAHAFVDLERANSIGFVVNIEQFSADNLVYFTKYITHLEDKGKKVVVLEISYGRKAEPMFYDSNQSIFIGRQQMNWLQFPSIKRMQELNSANLDILVNLDTSEKLTSRFVCGLSNAKTRVGVHESSYIAYYELLLQLPMETKLHKILETFEFYSKMLEK